jgi:hypothetical protein
MIKYTLIFTLLYSNHSTAETWNYKNGMSITAKDYKSAAKECYRKLTGGKYVGEEASLNIIDLCVNPKSFQGVK